MTKPNLEACAARLTAHHAMHLITLTAAARAGLSGQQLPEHMIEPTRAALKAFDNLDAISLAQSFGRLHAH